MGKETYQPTEAELDILKVIWDLQPVSVRDIHARLLPDKNVGYTTILKQIQRLTEKGVLDKQVVNGIHLYSSHLRESEVKEHLFDKVLHDAFGGSAFELMMHAVGSQKATPEELRALKEWLDNQIP